MTEANDNGEDLDAIYIDLCKAFDKVPHRRLILKLEKYGVNGEILLWTENFLQDRS